MCFACVIISSCAKVALLPGRVMKGYVMAKQLQVTLTEMIGEVFSLESSEPIDAIGLKVLGPNSQELCVEAVKTGTHRAEMFCLGREQALDRVFWLASGLRGISPKQKMRFVFISEIGDEIVKMIASGDIYEWRDATWELRYEGVLAAE